jgi:acyl-CoA reductase-like NAD-dependent aldehyde dehydrogenase
VFSPLISRGFLEFVYGGADVGAYCCQHPLVDSVHLTGSETTFNYIVYGTPEVGG